MRLVRHIGASRLGPCSPAPRAGSRARSLPIALAVGAVLLTGCGLLPSDSDATPAASPTRHRTHTAAPISTAAAAPSTTPEAREASETPTAEASPTADPVTVTRYSDKTSLLQLPVSPEALPGAPTGLVSFAEQQLTQMWHDQFQDELGCQGIAQVRVKRTIPTQAYVDASWGDMTPTCPQYAGNPGWWEIWGSASDGTWSVVLKGEGTAACADLVSAGVRRAVYPSCSDGTKKVPNPVG
ncbi:hypothetical protein [Nocardioides nematodiphilus]|uniref:hypothetical protein n=1 Tax=Nocardioides nematodiphilus TaxID=2849669 RepID=UPI001CDA2674|nr:hypothetical protein [Nocardioides nematodiphilus]MCA1982379.1 hypothetical protein [Nocardioides nematodiphilus]